MIPSWVSEYIGIPYSEYDCWEIYRLIYRKQLGIVLPKHNNYISSDDIESVEANFLESKVDWIKLDKPEPLCLVNMNIFGHPIHIGMYIDNTFMLHSLRGHNSALERHSSLKWKNRIEGYYKWPYM